MKASYLPSWVSKRSLFLLYFILVQYRYTRADQLDTLTGCGGFVTASPELSDALKKKIDFSNIKLRLVTPQGIVKETTECAPSGYYFVPIYDKGNFLLQIEGPRDWTFEPKEVAISVSAEDNQCRVTATGLAEDINFNFRPGFSVSGSAVGEGCSNTQKGPRGLTVTLSPKDNPKVKPITTTTDEKGHYTFSNVSPGKYEVSATHNSWSVSKAKVDVMVEWDSVKISTPFVVSGFDISGSVGSAGEAVQGVEFFLSSKTVKQIQGCTVPSGDTKALCVATSSPDGKFQFKNVPCGEYSLVPLYKGANTTFDVSPKSHPFTVDQESLELPEFQVMGFSVTGKVVDLKGNGIEGVEISVDGKSKTVTDANGTYKLDQLRSGQSYQISAAKVNMKFTSPPSSKVSANAPLPNIQLESYSLCGKVSITQQPSGITLKKAIRLLDSNQKEVARTTWDNSGSYCFDAKPGDYVVEPIQDIKEQQAGVLVHPAQLPVSLQTGPILTANFGQATLTLSGKITCLQKGCGGQTISVSLSNPTGGAATTMPASADGGFTFSGVVPGKYKVSVDKKEWCWDKDTQEIQITTANVSSLEFVQTGYFISIKTSHDIKVTYNLDKKNAEERTLAKGLNKFCLASPGVYTVKPISCYKFDKDEYSFDTSRPSQLELQANRYLLKGTIVQTKDIDKPTTFQVSISKSQDAAPTKVDAKFLRTEKDRTIYEYSYWAESSDQLKIKPVYHSVFLFYPEFQTITVPNAECPPEVPLFEARPGLFFSGKVVPPLKDVVVRVLEQESGDVVASLQSSVNGTFSVGPLYDDKKYSLTAEKPGYKFERLGDYDFKSMKLGQLFVSIIDKDKTPVPGVLVSLSGSNYRSNNVTQLNGSFTFINLAPGQFFLKPLLKEYVFEPASKTTDVADGADVSITFTAKRIAYSCYGNVSSLNGDPEKFVHVEAVGPQGEHEETQSDINGHYRIRGLTPGVNYEVRVKEDTNVDQRIERATPKSVAVKVTSDNVNNVNFIVFRRPSRLSISGIVETDPQWLSKLEVVLYKEESAVKKIPLGPSNFFDFTSLQKGNYTVRVKNSLPANIYSTKSSEQSIDLHQTVDKVHLTFSAEYSNREVNELSTSPIYGLIFGIGIILAVVYYQKLLDFYHTVILGKKKPELPDEPWIPRTRR